MQHRFDKLEMQLFEILEENCKTKKILGNKCDVVIRKDEHDSVMMRLNQMEMNDINLSYASKLKTKAKNMLIIK